ncbi:MAG: MerR family transcriptional regulator [Ginsengibacter sp.]|jgi:DNA-binding transcriptional MerR regulator
MVDKTQIDFEFDELDSSTKEEIQAAILPPSQSKRGRKSIKENTKNLGIVNVPDDEILFQKQYYPIGEVALMFRENNSLIRYWEKEFSLLKPKKNKKGDRFFRPEDVKILKLIHHLLREKKYTIEGAKEFLKNTQNAGEQQELVESLEKIKLFLLELKNNL